MDCSCNYVHDAVGAVSLRLMVLEIAWPRPGAAPLCPLCLAVAGRRLAFPRSGGCERRRWGAYHGIAMSHQYDVAQFLNAVIIVSTLVFVPCRCDLWFSR